MTLEIKLAVGILREKQKKLKLKLKELLKEDDYWKLSIAHAQI